MSRSSRAMRNVIVSMLLGVLAATAHANASPQTWDFRVFLDDKEIGSHRFDITGNGDTRTLTSRAKFNVRFLFVNAYSYQHEAVEGWDGDCLASLESHTDDNGKIHQVEARHRPNETVVQTGSGTERLGSCVMTFAYWNPAMLGQSRLLNSQNGEYVDVTITEVGTERIIVRGVSTAARRYALRSKGIARRYALRSKGMSIDLWYSDDDEWLALESVTEGGRRLRYRLK